MLAALLENNNNARQQAGFKSDPRASGGRSRLDRIDGDNGEQHWQYNIVDVIAAAAIFPEVTGEDPAARAARRIRWISEALPYIKEAREKREAAVFLAGTQLGAATERAEIEAAQKLSIAQLIQIIDEVRATPSPPVPLLRPLPKPACRGRGTAGLDFSNATIAIGLVLGGVVIGSLISGARKRRRR